MGFRLSLGRLLQLNRKPGDQGAQIRSGEVFKGVSTSDDHSAYNAYHKNGVRQLCRAHIIRKLKGLKESRSSPDAWMFSKNMSHEIGQIFACWHAFKSGVISRRQLLDATVLMRASSLPTTPPRAASALRSSGESRASAISPRQVNDSLKESLLSPGPVNSEGKTPSTSSRIHEDGLQRIGSPIPYSLNSLPR